MSRPARSPVARHLRLSAAVVFGLLLAVPAPDGLSTLAQSAPQAAAPPLPLRLRPLRPRPPPRLPPTPPNEQARQSLPLESRVNLVPVRVVVATRTAMLLPTCIARISALRGRRAPDRLDFTVETLTSPSEGAAGASANGSKRRAAPENRARLPAPGDSWRCFSMIRTETARPDAGSHRRQQLRREYRAPEIGSHPYRVGTTQTDFTDDRAKLRANLAKMIRAASRRAILRRPDCPSMDYYEAVGIRITTIRTSIDVATQDAVACLQSQSGNRPRNSAAAQASLLRQAQTLAQRSSSMENRGWTDGIRAAPSRSH